MKDRIERLIKALKLTNNAFATEIGVQRSNISHILDGRNNPSLDFVKKVVERYKDINLEWLVMGQGSMFKHPQELTLFPEEDNMPANDTKNTIQSPTATNVTPNNSSFKQNEPLVTNNTPTPNVYNDILPVNPEKKVEKIVIFYSDKTFESYNPM